MVQRVGIDRLLRLQVGDRECNAYSPADWIADDLSRAAASLLVNRLTFYLHCWWPCVHRRLTCHPAMANMV